MKFINYDRVAHVQIIPTGSTQTPLRVSVSYNWYGVNEMRNKIACVYEAGDNYHNVKWLLNAYINSTESGPFYSWTKVFVSPKCRTPRDYIRRSVPITHDKDKANMVIVPNLTDKIIVYKACMAFEYKHLDREDETEFPRMYNDLLLCSFAGDFSHFKTPYGTNTESEILKAFYESLGITDASSQGLSLLRSIDLNTFDIDDEAESQFTVTFIPAVEEYVDVLNYCTNKVGRKKTWAFEEGFCYDAPYKISPETLWIWERESDLEILQRSIAASDWKEYPFTVATLLKIKFEKEMTLSRMIGPMQIVARTLSFGNYNTLLGNSYAGCKNLLITPKDWSMLQSWIFKDLGLDTDSGFIDLDKYSKLPKELQTFTKMKVAVAKAKLPQSEEIQVMKQ